jgi:hypothetical protein
MVRAELKNGAPQKLFWNFGEEIPPLIFFSDFGAEMARPRPFLRGGGANGGILGKFAPL